MWLCKWETIEVVCRQVVVEWERENGCVMCEFGLGVSRLGLLSWGDQGGGGRMGWSGKSANQSFS